MITTNEIRRQFLDFFADKGHTILPSASLVPQNDPTLMFNNAGMNQFKHVFTGAEQPKSPRATTTQKCVRAGGKHNDLDNVGYTARHHTFFEMLGNFSFGDYFKKDAIAYAWELLTEVWKLPPEKLYVTVYHTDDEAFRLWKETTGFPDEKILRIPTKDNFWQMGDTGPCGPCSEIFYDHGTGNGEWALDETGHDLFDERYVEIWNLVFMQYDRQPDGTDNPLPAPCIDTGMGLERMTAVLQGKHNNYDIDLFQNLIGAIDECIFDSLPHSPTARAMSLRPSATKEARSTDLASSPTETMDTRSGDSSKKVIADHLRSAAFLIADGVLPSNEGRGYVLRRIMRRAMRHAHLLGCKEPLMYRLVPALIKEMGDAYPELKRAEAVITENLKAEEERFKATLDRGLKLLEEETGSMKENDVLPGETAFKLYDTFGFPLDLTQDILRGKSMTVDEAGFDAAMAEQKARARAAWSGSGDAGQSAIWLELRDRLGATEFLGYIENSCTAEVLSLVKDGEETTSLNKGEKGQLITNQTPFYGESGGQQGDTGWININGKVVAEVLDTKKPADGLHVHTINAVSSIKTGDTVQLKIDDERRAQLRANHSATHLLNAALRIVLGDHITQKGSEVAADKLRFDISHNSAMSDEEIAQAEAIVNQQIWANAPVKTQLMATDDAINAGATAMFGEKYGDEVRVLSMGTSFDSLPSSPTGLASSEQSLGTRSADSTCAPALSVSHSEAETNSPSRGQQTERRQFSVELCGGTHVQRTGDIGLFKITSEGALAAGVRRIEAVTRDGAFGYLNQRNNTLSNLAQEVKVSVSDLPERITQLLNDKKKLEKQLAEAKKQLAMGGSGGSTSFEKTQVGDITLATQAFNDINPKDLRDLATQILQKINSGVVAVGSNFDSKAGIIVAISKDLTGDLNSAELIRVATPVVGGQGGGGRPEMAQGGGPDGAKVADALAAVKAELAKRLDKAA